MNSTTHGTSYGTCHSSTYGGPNGKSMASRWLSQTQTQTQTILIKRSLAYDCMHSLLKYREGSATGCMP